MTVRLAAMFSWLQFTIPRQMGQFQRQMPLHRKYSRYFHRTITTSSAPSLPSTELTSIFQASLLVELVYLIRFETVYLYSDT